MYLVRSGSQVDSRDASMFTSVSIVRLSKVSSLSSDFVIAFVTYARNSNDPVRGHGKKCQTCNIPLLFSCISATYVSTPLHFLSAGALKQLPRPALITSFSSIQFYFYSFIKTCILHKKQSTIMSNLTRFKYNKYFKCP